MWFVEVYMFVKSFFEMANYSIRKVYLEYDSPPRPAAGYSDFWKSEERYWGEDSEKVWTDVTRTFKKLGPTPEGVSNEIFRIKYVYDNKNFTCVTRNPLFMWPPMETRGARFVMPITNAMLIDDNGPVRDVTKKIIRYMGPRKDFHGEDVTVEDLFLYDDYTHIQVKNIMNQTNEFSRYASCLELL